MAARKKIHWAWLLGLLIVGVIISACARQMTPASAPEQAFYGGADTANRGAAEEAAEPPAAPADMDIDRAAVDQMTAGPAIGADGTTQQIERLIIRDGYISVSVEDTRAARNAIEQMVGEMAGEGGFVVNASESGGTTDSSPYISMQIRISAARFDEAMNRIAGMAVEGTQPTRRETAQDVTEEYVDLAARLESLEAARDRLLQIMENAQTTEELLQAESQLTAREQEIESIKGRMQYLEQSAALSSIQIELQPYILSQPVDTSWRPAETVRRAFEALVNSLRAVADFVLYSGIACLPWILVVGLIGYGVYRVVRSLWRRRRGSANTSTTSTP